MEAVVLGLDIVFLAVAMWSFILALVDVTWQDFWRDL